MPEKKLSKNLAAMISVTVLMLIINAASWISTGLTDFYAQYIFAPVSDVVSAITGKLPFSLGEVMICIGIMLVIAAPFIFVPLIIRKKKKIVKGFGIFYGWVLIFILVTETLNCFVLYHTTEFSEKYHGGAGRNGFTASELSQMCEETITEANRLAQLVRRDENGRMEVPADLDAAAYEAMNRLAEDYPQLKGFYPMPKTINSSMLMTQFDLQGIYFPFSLEANINKELSPARVPCTAMHELSHLKGFIREDEACFIAYRACLESDIAEIQYSGILSAMNYLFSETKKNVSEAELNRLRSLISPLVYSDNTFVSEEYRQTVEQKAVISTKTASAVSDRAMEAALKFNGVSDGKKSYGRMVNLLLEYRYCIKDDNA